MQSYRAAQQAVGGIFGKYSGSFQDSIDSFVKCEIEKEEFLGALTQFMVDRERMFAEVMQFFESKVNRTKVLTAEDLLEANPELSEEEMELMLRNQNSKDAKKLAKKAESEAKKLAKKAEAEEKKLAKKAEAEAKKLVKKAEAEAKKLVKKAELSNARKKATEERKMMRKEDAASKNVLESFSVTSSNSSSNSSVSDLSDEDADFDKELIALANVAEEIAKAKEEEKIANAAELVKVIELAELERAELERAELERAELERAELERAELEKAELEKAELEKAELARAELAKAELAKAELAKAELAKAELERAARDVKDEDETAAQITEVKFDVKKRVKKTKESKEKRHIVKQNGDNMFVEDTLQKIKYILREGICYTETKIIGKWNEEEDSIEFYNLGEDEAKQITFASVYDFDAESSFENRKVFINGDCLVYHNAQGDIWGRYQPLTNTIVAEEEEDEEEYD
uniref:Uncharacterized protein n=1 Tax=viral metagenome TaxID=1070528 RepID=A0A6C0HS29_9ZZZZ